jgi:hypothetical protein
MGAAHNVAAAGDDISNDRLASGAGCLRRMVVDALFSSLK